MRRLIILIIFLGCNKNIIELLSKNKVGGIYWLYVKEDRDKDLKEYLDRNILDFNEINEEGETLLTLAVKCNSLNVLNLLSDQKEIEINKTNKKGQTALIAAILDSEDSLERDEIIDKLLKKGSNTNLNYGLSGNNTLMLAIIKQDTFLVNKILNENININDTNLFEETALILAVKSDIKEDKKIEIINELFKNENIGINLQDKEGKSALTYAVIINNPKIVNILSNIDKIDTNILDKENMTPLDHLNFENFEVEIALSLIKNGAISNNRKKFYERAIEKNLLDVIELLMESKGDINYSKENKDLLHFSIMLFNSNMYGSLILAKYLIEKIDINLDLLKKYIRYAKIKNSDIFYILQIFFYKNSNIYCLIKENMKDIKNKEEILKNNFLKAAEIGNIEFLKILINGDFNINEEDNYGKIALIEAARNGHKEVVKLLIEKGADVNIKDKTIRTALIEAVENSHTEVVKILIEREANVNSKDGFYITPLLKAVENGHIEIVKLLLEKDANIEAADLDGNTPLLEATKKGRKDIEDLLLERRVTKAVENGPKEELMKLSLEEEMDIEMVDLDDNMPLSETMEKRYHMNRKLFLERKVHNVANRVALIEASGNGNKERVEQLLEKGVDVNAKYIYENKTALIKAAEKGYVDVVKLLIERGADVNAVDSDGSTSLIVAARNGHKEVVNLLIEKDIDIDIRDFFGKTSLAEAAGNGHKNVVELLIEREADVNAIDYLDVTVLMEAAGNGHKNIVELLIERGADINAKDRNGNTALLLTAIHGYENLLNLLLEKDAEIDKREEFLKKFLLINKPWKNLNRILRLILKQQIKYMGNHELLIIFSRSIKINKEYILVCKFILNEMKTDNIIFYKILEKLSNENNRALKEEISKKIKLLKRLLKLPMEIFWMIISFM